MPGTADRTREIVGSPIRKITAMIEKAKYKKNIISFGGGAPSLAPPKEIITALIEDLKKQPQQTTAYGATKGKMELLQLISELLKNEEKIDINPEKEICGTIGGTEALYLAIYSTINPGDEVLISDPTYFYEQPIKLAKGKPVRIPCHWEEDFQLLPERVNEAITDKTKMIMLITPDNPTGRVLKDENFKGVVDIAEDNDIWLLTDDIYKDILYNGKFKNSRTFGAYDNTITCCSFSKTASIPGMRAGYVYGPEKVISDIEILKQFVSLCEQRPVQTALIKLLESKAKVKNNYIRETVLPTYRSRRDVMAKGLKEKLPELGFSMPKGAFYFFIDFSEYIKRLGLKNEEEFCDKLFKEENLVLIPGGYFGKKGKNHVRMTFVSEPEERITEGLDRIKEFVGN